MTRALVVLLVLAAAGCADIGESRDARLERLEARLDRLDDRLTRAEERLQAPAPAGGAAASAAAPGLEALLGDLDPEARERLRARFGSIRERLAKLREGADIDAPAGSPEHRRALLLDLLRRYRDAAVPPGSQPPAAAPTPAG